MLGLFITAAVAVRVSLSSRELLGLGGKQDENTRSTYESALAAPRTPPQETSDTPLRDCDLGGSLKEVTFELGSEGQRQSWQLFSGESIDPNRQGRVCQRQRRLPAGVCQHVRELPVPVQERVPAARERTRLQRG